MMDIQIGVFILYAELDENRTLVAKCPNCRRLLSVAMLAPPRTVPGTNYLYCSKECAEEHRRLLG